LEARNHQVLKKRLEGAENFKKDVIPVKKETTGRD